MKLLYWHKEFTVFDCVACYAVITVKCILCKTWIYQFHVLSWIHQLHSLYMRYFLNNC